MAVKGTAADPQFPGSLGNIPAVPFQGFLKGRKVQLSSLAGDGIFCRCCRFPLDFPIGLENLEDFSFRLAAGEQEGDPFHHIGQFSDIPGPGVCFAGPHDPQETFFFFWVLLESYLTVDGPSNLQVIIFPLAQGEDGEAEHIQPIVQVPTEFFFFHQAQEIPVGGGDDPDIH